MSQDRRLSNSQESKIHESKRDKKSELIHKPRITSLTSPTNKKLNYNFTVAVRVRPPTQSDQHGHSFKQSPHIQYQTTNKNVLVLQYPEGTHHSYFASKHRKFNFDHIFIHRSNRDIYEQLVKPKLSVLKQNNNLTVLTYGITGSGKTHTIFGKSQLGEEGLVMMCFQDVMKQAAHQDMKFSFCFMQIYNEQVHDLLREDNVCYDPTAQQSATGKLKAINVMEDSKGKVNIPELTKIQIKSPIELRKLVDKGNATRASSSNLINKLSSRSHALMQLFCFNEKTKIQNTVTIIDLAGSERHSSVFNGTEALNRKSLDKQNKNLQKEGSNINKSLLALGSCIKGLENGQAHIPYRDSKLTRILKDDLSGKAQNIMIACVGRNLNQAEETINTLNYASRAAKIKVQKFVNSPIHNNFQCSFCFKLTPWKEVLKRMPVRIVEQKFKQGKEDFDKATKKAQVDLQCVQNLNLTKLLKDYKGIVNQQYNNLRAQILNYVKNIDNFSQIQLTSNSNYPSNLFREQRKATEKQKMYSKINHIFDFYQTRIMKQFEYDLSLLKQSPEDGIMNQFYQNCGEKNSQLFGESDSSPENKSCQAPFYRNNGEYLISNNNFTLESYREQALNDINQTCGNLRKKLSLKNNKDFLNSANTTKATLSDFSQAYYQAHQHESHKISKIKRMSPDVEGEGYPTQRVSYKKAIINKIEEAKKKCINQLEFAHENCPRFEYEELQNPSEVGNPMNKNYLPRQRARSFIKIKQDEMDEICVSSFTEDSNQCSSCC